MTRNQIFAYVIGGIVALIAIGNIFSSDDDSFNTGVVRINVGDDNGNNFKAVNTPDGEVKCQNGQSSVTYTHSDGSTTEIMC